MSSTCPEGSPLKDSCPQSWSGNTVEGYKEQFSYQEYQQQQPVSAQQFQPQDISVKVPLQTSANGVSPKQDDYYNSPQQHPPSLNNNYPLPSTQCSDHQHPPQKSLSYEEFIAADEQENSSSADPETGFPIGWPKVTSHPLVDVTSPRVEEQPSPAKVTSLQQSSIENVYSPPITEKAVARTPLPPLPPPPPSPPTSSGSGCCCIIL